MKCKPWFLPHKYSNWEVGFRYVDSSWDFNIPMIRMVSTCSRCGWTRTKDVDSWESFS